MFQVPLPVQEDCLKQRLLRTNKKVSVGMQALGLELASLCFDLALGSLLRPFLRVLHLEKIRLQPWTWEEEMLTGAVPTEFVF